MTIKMTAVKEEKVKNSDHFILGDLRLRCVKAIPHAAKRYYTLAETPDALP